MNDFQFRKCSWLCQCAALCRNPTLACGLTSTPTNTQKPPNHKRRTDGRMSGSESATGKGRRRGSGPKTAPRKMTRGRAWRAGLSPHQRTTGGEERRPGPPTCSSRPRWRSTRATCPTCTEPTPTARATTPATRATVACPLSWCRTTQVRRWRSKEADWGVWRTLLRNIQARLVCFCGLCFSFEHILDLSKVFQISVDFFFFFQQAPECGLWHVYTVSTADHPQLCDFQLV